MLYVRAYVQEALTCAAACSSLQSGKRDSRVSRKTSDLKVTSACLDTNQRRLLTANNDGSINSWNPNCGRLLRRLRGQQHDVLHRKGNHAEVMRRP